ncbi:hypothetical protein [Pseudoteredinibacter isoporae]|uniref:hypothetical protein n=1 Tax=Pseudoteredinibacter isoporae TaxID=570281 RepID=UPI00310AEFAC
MSAFTDKQLIGIGVVGLVAVVYLSKKASEVATDVGQSINPINDQNIFYSGVNNLGAYVSGNPDWNLGTSIYDWLN